MTISRTIVALGLLLLTACSGPADQPRTEPTATPTPATTTPAPTPGVQLVAWADGMCDGIDQLAAADR
ncbi:hypothetical protein HPO96_33510 [Kribbella sandramycini]|uniref:Uncharacterized protein n=1 Tax=Kribbella sandramycini TaxID=60450 RepID=A0A7Y4L881_9ACTN|nr:hypothetical protein [Kribbella sandramycini]MBB6570313.1 hypothetical protein [Kribbella sandramycini]NOL45177.1 hypothetical protein [Kribbella sandramycini]